MYIYKYIYYNKMTEILVEAVPAACTAVLPMLELSVHMCDASQGTLILLGSF